MSNIHDNSWLNPLLVNNSFPWDQATPTTFPELLRRITFHDGYWHGCFPALDDNSCLLVLQPDTVWNPEFCHRQEPWPYLIIEVSRVLHMSRDVVPDAIMPGISNVESAPVNAARFLEWLEFAKVYDLVPADFFDYQKPQPRCTAPTFTCSSTGLSHSFTSPGFGCCCTRPPGRGYR